MKLDSQNPQIRFFPATDRRKDRFEVRRGEPIVEFDVGRSLTVTEVGEPECADEVVVGAEDAGGTVCGHAVCDLDGFDVDGSVAWDLRLRDLTGGIRASRDGREGEGGTVMSITSTTLDFVVMRR
jgi:hypothetical protein